MDLREFLEKDKCFHFLKWVQVIQQESLAEKKDAMYILEKDKDFCDIIFIDSNGNKRKIGVNIPHNIALIDIVNELGEIIRLGNVYTKIQVDSLLTQLEIQIADANAIQDDRLDAVEIKNTAQDVILDDFGNILDDHNNRIINLEGLNYIWNPTNRTLNLYDNNGTLLSQVSLVSLDNEGTDLRYNATTKSLELWNSDNKLLDSIPIYDFVGNVGTQLNLNSDVLTLRDSQGTILSTINFTVSNISGLQAALNLKLDKPTTTVTNTTTYTHAVLVDSNGNPAKYLAGDLGKNVANSLLTSIAGAGLKLGANWILNTSGFYYSITGLADVSSDSKFNVILMQNNAGRVAKSNGKGVFNSLPTLLTDVEKTAWKTAMNGGWTTNTMSVFLINPVVINRTITTNQYISVLGANLNFLSTNFSVEIMDSTGVTSVATIPNSNVQLQSSGLSLIFHYNFNTLPAGTYKLRLNNGVATYTTQVTFELRNTVDNYDLTGLTWSKKVYNDLLLPYFNSSPNSVNFNGDLKNIDGTDFNEDSISADFITVASRTSMIGSMSDDFVIEVSINNPSTFTFALSSIGITTSSSDNLINDLIVRAQIGGWGNANIGDGSVNVPANNNNNDRFIIIKKGQLLQYIITGSFQAFTKTVSVTNANIPFFIKIIRNNGGTTNGGNTSITTGNIISAYKLN